MTNVLWQVTNSDLLALTKYKTKLFNMTALGPNDNP